MHCRYLSYLRDFECFESTKARSSSRNYQMSTEDKKLRSSACAMRIRACALGPNGHSKGQEASPSAQIVSALLSLWVSPFTDSVQIKWLEIRDLYRFFSPLEDVSANRCRLEQIASTRLITMTVFLARVSLPALPRRRSRARSRNVFGLDPSNRSAEASKASKADESKCD
jgi:hypothetical protein